ncbi:hypothetical protein F0562_010971 [Nyssa sinensis]|uniref:Integrase zinc-binding domain-containing protein n=1 Tax=Nyssa sinensis TaxID=561372 RepID=A0A5J5A3F6_9ASTE|nr:hypothetical protein F0562_010971 [Nyssa sinensis]
MLEGDDGSTNLLDSNVTEEQPTEEIHEELFEPEITLHALTRWTAPKTMRLAARIGFHDVIVLIDSGSTHNFISERMANLLRLPVVPTEAFTVRVASGTNLRCQGRFEDVKVDLQGTIFSLTLYSLPLTGLDVVLGIQWLELLGSVVCDWKRLTMEFSWENQPKKLIGIDGQDIHTASAKELSKALHHGQALFALCFQVAQVAPQATIHPSMQELLHDFSDLFLEPTSLPPTREVDHCIALKEGMEPINVRPYSLKYLLEQRMATPEQQKWVAKLLGYDYEILYHPGRENSTADALSRKPGSSILYQIFLPQISLWEDIKEAAKEDPYIQSMGRVALEQPGGSYTWRHGLLLYKGKVIVPGNAALKAKLLHEMHDTKVGGHSGVLRTFKKLRQQFYWPGIHHSVQAYVKECEVCWKIKAETLAPAGLLQPLPIPCRVWEVSPWISLKAYRFRKARIPSW